MEDYQESIVADGGDWAYAEVLGGYAIAKVRASAETLTTIAGDADIQRIPNWVSLTEKLGTLTTAQRTAILNKLEDMGYTLTEIQNALGSNLAGWRTKTLGDLLKFAARRRRKPRYDIDTDAIVCDGPEQVVRSIESINEAI